MQHLKLNVGDCVLLHLTYKSVIIHFEKKEFDHVTGYQLIAEVTNRGQKISDLIATITVNDKMNQRQIFNAFLFFGIFTGNITHKFNLPSFQ